MSGQPMTHQTTRGSVLPRFSRLATVRFGLVSAIFTLAILVPAYMATASLRHPAAGGGLVAQATGSASPRPAGATANATATPTSLPSSGGGALSSGGANPEVKPGAAATPAATPRPAASAPPATPRPAPASTATAVYVSTTGSDSNPGTLSAPFRTIGHAAAVARSGAKVFIRGGTYAGFDVTRSGITFAPYQGESVVVSAGSRENAIEISRVTSATLSGLVIQGSTVQYGSGIMITGSSGVTVSGSTIRNNRTFGIVIARSSAIRIDGNAITGNADGIEERYAGNGVVIANNRIYANTKMVDSGRGMEGINFYKSTGVVTVSGNRLWDNGTHFEVYGASNLNITGNATWNGQIMETGTDGPACNNNRFTRNIGYKGSGYQGGSTNGMILRCASNNLVAQNTLDGFDLFAFDVVDGTQGVSYGGSIAGLRILNNIVVGGRAFSIDSALPTTVKIDYNLLYNVGSTATYGNHLAYMKGVGQFDSLDAFSAATGYETHGVFGDPRFVNRAGRDYHLTSGSPAIDRGLVVLSDGYTGSKPDLGRYEFR
jgi:parallel beta-helix repeat protein